LFYCISAFILLQLSDDENDYDSYYEDTPAVGMLENVRILYHTFSVLSYSTFQN